MLGGVLTEALSWRWIFFVNLPIAVLAIVLTAIVFQPSPRQADRAVDVPGMLAFATAATAVTYGVIRGGEHGWSDSPTLLALASGAVALMAFVFIESRSATAMFPLTLLGNRNFGATLVSASGQTFAAFAATPLISLWLQQQLHMSPMRAGLAMLPMAATAFVVAGVFGKLLHNVSPKWTIGAGLISVGVGSALLTIIDTESSWAALVPGLVVIGAGIGINAPALVAVGMAAVPPQQGGIAAGAVNTARQLGLALGVAVLGTVFREVADDSRPMTLSRFVAGLNAAFGVTAAVGIVFGAIAFGLFHRQRQVADAPVQPQTVVT